MLVERVSFKFPEENQVLEVHKLEEKKVQHSTNGFGLQDKHFYLVHRTKDYIESKW